MKFGQKSPATIRAERWAMIEREIGTGPICSRCNATLATYADACTADLNDLCPGFVTVDAAKVRAAEAIRR